MNVRVKDSWIKHLDFIFADLVCVNVALLLAFFLRVGVHNMYKIEQYRVLIGAVIVFHLFIAFVSKFYSGILKRGYLVEANKVIVHNLILFAIIMTYMYLMQLGGRYSRIVVISFFFMDTILMYLNHIVAKFVINKRESLTTNKSKILVLSTPELINEAIVVLKDGPDQSFTISAISFYENKEGIEEVQGIPVVTQGRDIYEYACRHTVDGVFIYLGSNEQHSIEEITNNFLRMGITVHINMDMIADGLPNVYFGHMNGAQVMTTSINDIGLTDAIIKRSIDIVAGILGCLITLLLAIVIAPAIKIADPKGPVFFKQQRAGKNGRPFNMYKFRSMYSDAEERKQELMNRNKMDGLMFKMDADPRVIGSGKNGNKKGLGHFLRSSSLDEFPNFINILKGDMSMVGTRPPTMDEYNQYKYHHKSRLTVKPGLTGIWQVSGRSGLTDFEEIVKLDNEYIRNWSIGLDIKIILKTVLVVITRDGSI